MASSKTFVMVLAVSIFLSACGGGESEGASSGPKDVDEWWAEIETCVNKKETAKKNSKDNHLHMSMYDEWEAECAADKPYNAGPSVQDQADRTDASVVQEEAEIEVTLSKRRVSTPGIGVIGKYIVPIYQGDIVYLLITSLNDYIQILDVEVNRGRCEFTHDASVDVNNFPVELGFTEKSSIYLKCDIPSVREVSVTTNLGILTYRF